jgi:hypothetical protein
VEDTSPYWGAVVQVAPVLALALVLEYRGVARRFVANEDSFANSRAVRFLFAMVLGLAGLFLTVGFGIALFALSRGGPVDDWRRWVADSALIYGMSVVVGTPLLNLLLGLAGDTVIGWHRRMPYSRRSREARKMLAVLAQRETELRSIRAERLELWMSSAQNYVQLLRLERQFHDLEGRNRRTFREQQDALFGAEDRQRSNLSRIRGTSEQAEAELSDIRGEIARYRAGAQNAGMVYSILRQETGATV